MKCFNHHDRDAFGEDYFTGKGLCLECMEEYKGIIIEKNNEFSKKAAERHLKMVSGNFSASRIFYYVFLIMGIISTLVGVLSFNTLKPDFGLFLSGLFFLILSFGYRKFIK